MRIYGVGGGGCGGGCGGGGRGGGGGGVGGQHARNADNSERDCAVQMPDDGVPTKRHNERNSKSLSLAAPIKRFFFGAPKPRPLIQFTSETYDSEQA